MKTLFTFLTMVLTGICTLQAQDDPPTVKAWRIWVLPAARGHNTEGVLYEVKDSSVLISQTILQKNYITGKFTYEELAVKDIKAIHLRKKGSKGLGLMIGGAAGAVIGAIIGLSAQFTGGPPDQGLKISTVLLTTGIGLGVGGTIGSVNLRVPIKGSQARFDKSRKKLEVRAIKNYLGAAQAPGATFSKLKETLTDIDGNVYHLLALGGQVWMAENLKVTRFRDGSFIPGLSESESQPGLSYAWSAISDNRKICPSGWHVPTMEEWTSLYNSLGGGIYAGYKMEAGFLTLGKAGRWWSSTETDTLQSKGINLDNATSGFMIASMDKTSALPVRCIRD